MLLVCLQPRSGLGLLRSFAPTYLIANRTSSMGRKVFSVPTRQPGHRLPPGVVSFNTTSMPCDAYKLRRRLYAMTFFTLRLPFQVSRRRVSWSAYYQVSPAILFHTSHCFRCTKLSAQINSNRATPAYRTPHTRSSSNLKSTCNRE